MTMLAQKPPRTLDIATWHSKMVPAQLLSDWDLKH
jgi:hypothetical protein